MKKQSLLNTVVFAASIIAFVGVSTSASAADRARFDSSFGSHRIVKTATEADIADYVDDDFDGGIGDMALDAQGRIVVGGSGGDTFLVARYLANGRLDESFGDHGKVKIRVGEILGGPLSIHSKVTAIAIQPDRRILLFGTVEEHGVEDGPPFSRDVAIRLNPDGSSDESFFGEGAGVAYGGSRPASITLLKNGSFLVSGRQENTTDWSPLTEGYVAQYQADGHEDPSLAGGSVQFRPGPPRHAGIVKTKVLASGKLLAGGYYENKLLLSRFHPNGKPDRSFGTNGRVERSLIGHCTCAVVSSMRYDNKGRIILAGWAFPGSKVQNQTFIARFFKNGKIDKTFGKHGVVTHKVDPYVTVGDVAVQDDGRIVLEAMKGDERQSKLILFRYLSDGKLDKTFFRRGHLTQQFGSATKGAKLLIDAKGRILVGGGYAQDGKGNFLLERILPGR